MKSEKGITLAILVIYVIFFSIIIGLLAALSTYIYSNLEYINDDSVDVSEFNKFNMYFIEDVKTNKQAEIKQLMSNDGKNVLQIAFEDGDTYRYIKEEKTIYKNMQKIAKNIQDLDAMQIEDATSNKKYIEIRIKIGAKGETNYEQKINYVLKYW